MKHFLIYLIGLSAIIVSSCSSSDEKPATPDNFYPLAKGSFQIYHVEEITYTLGKPDTAFYELETIVVDSFLNAESNYTYVIHRNKRNEGEQNWTYLDTWSATSSNDELVVKEGNIPFVKLAFPAVEGRTWNGNEYNNLINQSTSQQNDSYTIIKRGKSDSFPEGEYVDVEQEDNQEFVVFFDKRIERYTQGIGLVYKETTQLAYCTQTDCLGQQKVESGVILKQTLTQYGKE